MTTTLPEKLGGISLVLGAILFAVYSSLFTVLLPSNTGRYDYGQVVHNPNWTRLALIAIIGILLMPVGFYAGYARQGRGVRLLKPQPV